MPTVEGNKLKSNDFVHLHTHTHHSLLDGLQKIPKVVEKVKSSGMEAVAITDHGTLSGAIEFYSEAKNNGIKPIIGIETYVAQRSHLDKDPTKDRARWHLILLAMNNKGYENLMRLSTIANLDGFYHKPRIDKELLEKYNEGLIVLSGCMASELSEVLMDEQFEKAYEIANWYKKVFGDRYYIEIQDHAHQWEQQKILNEKLLKVAKKVDVPVVLTSDSHYLNHSDQEAHEVLLCVQTGSYLSDEKRMSLKNTDLYLATPEEIIERWQDMPEVIQNSKKIADRCDIEIDLGGILIPKFDLPKGEKTEKEYLHKLVYRGLVNRYTEFDKNKIENLSIEEAKKLLDKNIIERAEYEMSVISNMGFDGYFLIVQDFINWGKNQGIVFGPGRGSAAGSIVAYAINITDLDPLEFDLLFERFLNPDRISMPDIDIDIQDSRRDEVIEYCVEKYGQDRVAHIVTFGTMAARNAIRDVSRVLEVPYAEADRLAKMVPPPIQGRHIPLEVSVKEDSDLKKEYEVESSKRVIDLAIKLEGTIRSHGVHAAGVVIAPDDIVKFTPLEMAQKGVVATQYPMNPIEDLGLLKMDFLGLSNLTIVKNALRIIKRVYETEIDISTVDMYDEKTFNLLRAGDTTGVFQFESAGMKRYIKQLKPTKFDDLIALAALYRPGPLSAGYTDDFVATKNGERQVKYDHPKMENALQSTYGILVYQEQVMQIAKDMCGFSGGQADTLRKAIGKKKADLMAKMKKEFIEGMVESSKVSQSFAADYWDKLEGFADYCFNKSHSACYALIAYWTAFLKAHYPDAFMAALMTSDYDDTDRLAIEINECRHMGLKVLPPDINQSYLEFSVVPDENEIRFGLAAVKNVGHAAVEEIEKVRAKDGHFKSVEDFAIRVNSRVVNKKTWESLIKAGAFDRFEDRGKLLANLETIISFAQKAQKEADSGQTDLFGGSDDPDLIPSLELLAVTNEYKENDYLLWERELLGLYLSKHPLDGFEKYFEENTVPITDVTSSMDNKTVKVGGVILESREITTKNGSKMAFVLLADKTTETELIVFPNTFNERPELWQKDKIVWVEGKVNTKDREGNSTDEIKIIVNNFKEVTSEMVENYVPTGKKATTPKQKTQSKPKNNKQVEKSKLFIHVKKPDDNEAILKLKQLLNQYPGKQEAILVLGEKNQKSAIRLPFGVEISEKLKDDLIEAFTKECIVVS